MTMALCRISITSCWRPEQSYGPSENIIAIRRMMLGSGNRSQGEQVLRVSATMAAKKSAAKIYGEKGYGMLEGKTADPEDPFRSFMLNGYAYLGLSRVAEMFEKLGLAEFARWKTEAEELKADIRDSFFSALASSPVVPLGDGRWCPTCPPWVESRGPLALHIDGTAWHTHGSMVARDSLLGPLYLVYQEILDPRVTRILLARLP